MVLKQKTETGLNETSDFKHVVGTTGAALRVLRSGNFHPGSSLPLSSVEEKGSSYSDSISLLRGSGLRPLSRRDALLLLTKDEGLKRELEGTSFYLAEAGINMRDLLFTKPPILFGSSILPFALVSDRGELVDYVGKAQESLEQRVYIEEGEKPLLLYVSLDYEAEGDAARFTLSGNTEGRLANAVVGVPFDYAEELSKLRYLIRTTLPQIIGALEPSSNNAVLEGLKRIQRKASED